MLITSSSTRKPYQNNTLNPTSLGIAMEAKSILRQNLLNAVLLANNRIVTDVSTAFGEEVDPVVLGEQIITYFDNGSIFGAKIGEIWIWDSNESPTTNKKGDFLTIQDFTSIIAIEVLAILSYTKCIRNTMKVIAKEHQVDL